MSNRKAAIEVRPVSLEEWRRGVFHARDNRRRAERRACQQKDYCRRILAAKVRAHHHRAQHDGGPGQFTTDQWLAKIEYHGWRCYLCRRPLNPDTLTFDHRKPLSRGGSDWLANLAPACERCNGAKGNKSEAEFRCSTTRDTNTTITKRT